MPREFPILDGTGTDRLLRTLAIVVCLSGLILCTQPYLWPTRGQAEERAIVEALLNREGTAWTLAEKLLATGETPARLALAAEAAALCKHQDTADSLYRRLPRDNGGGELCAELGLARRATLLGRAWIAEGHLRRVLELDPWHLEANRSLGHLLQVEGRTWEGVDCFFIAIQRGKCRGDELLGLTGSDRYFRNDERLEELGLRAKPPEAILKLAQARRMLYENQNEEAEAILRELTQEFPDLGEAQGRLGRIIVDRGNLAEFLQWRGGLTETVRQHPEVWFAQGLQARRLGQTKGAIRCFLETLDASPNHLAATVQLAGSLQQANQPEVAAKLTRHGQLLAAAETSINLLRSNTDPPLMTKTARLLADCGRYWEAAGWNYILNVVDPDNHPARREASRCLEIARAQLPGRAARSPAAELLRRGDYPEPRWPAPAVPDSRSPSDSSGDQSLWKFVEEARPLGINFTYYEGTTEATRMQHIFNTMGGGLGALDFDLDGWPDLYLAQAHNWRDARAQPEHSDRLFRNRTGAGFQDVTVPAGVAEQAFSHGVTVGDFDQDGFPDLYVGNKGPNRLLKNNGDGTFSDVTGEAGVAGSEWTTSSVLADFSGDGLPDLYVLNYTRLQETADKECQQESGHPVACTPDVLTAEDDRFYLNLGDGRFQDATRESEVTAPNGRGLGVVAWDFDHSGRLGLFVANDTSTNFLLIPARSTDRGVPVFKDEAVVRGVALDLNGKSQASMGVAAGDLNADGNIDLCITNFFAEGSTLYLQDKDGFFEDASRPWKVFDNSFWMLGFGCQFADFDGDGWEDLVVTNGHVDKQTSKQEPDRMRPQLFRNLQGRGLDEVPEAQLGAFFEETFLGRGLAVFDWNRDGRPDFGVSHLHSPFALVTNHSESLGDPLTVRLIGTAGCREPVGARVRVRTSAGVQVRLLTAGDGFLVSNERRLSFSIPRGETASIEVDWSPGRMETWSSIGGKQEVTLVQGQPGIAAHYKF